MKSLKYLMFMLVFVISFSVFHSSILAGNYKSYKVGDIVTYEGINFYVIADSDDDSDYVTLLKAEPLTVDEVNTYGKDHVNRYTRNSVGTATDQNGYGGMAYYSSATCGYKNGSSDSWIETGCTTDYAQSDIKYVVDAWVKDKFNSNDLSVDKTGYSARVLTYDELTTNLGYVVLNENTLLYVPRQGETPSWVYNSNYSYWLMSQTQDSYFGSWYVNNGSGGLGSCPIGDLDKVVRPVINLKKHTNSDVTNNGYLSGTEYKIGDIITYNGIKFYVIKNATKSDPTVTMLKAEPLSLDEVNAYGAGHVNMYNDFNPGQADADHNYGYMSYLSTDTCKIKYDNNKSEATPITTGCTTDYNLSDVKYVVDNWSKIALAGLELANDHLGYKVRLITFDELLNNLNYVVNDENLYSYSRNTPSWVYNSDYSYLTMSPADDSSTNIIRVDFDGTLNANTYIGVSWLRYRIYNGAVRPVITVKKQVDTSINEDATKVKIPDTLLNIPVSVIIVGIILIIIGITIFVILKKRSKK